MTNLLPALVALTAGGVALLAGLVSLRAESRGEDPEASSSRRHRGPSSGTILAVATVGAVLGIGAPTARMFGLLGIGLLLGGAGLLADRKQLRPAFRVGAEGAAGAAGLIVGLDTGITALDAANALLVAVFVVVTVESLRLLDSAPRAGAAVAAPLAVALALVATFVGTDQAEAVLLAAALSGALVGSLVAGATRPFWLGESGCLFAGFLLAALLVDLPTSTPAPLNALVVLPLVAVPFFNAAVVALARLRRRRPVTQRRPDGLAHRLRAMRLSWPKAIALLGGLQALVGVAVVLADRGDLPVATPVLVGMVSVAVLVVPTVAGKGVYRHRAVGLSRTVRLAALGVTVVLAAAVVPGALALVTARGEVALGVASAEGGLEAARRGEIEVAEGRNLRIRSPGNSRAGSRSPTGCPGTGRTWGECPSSK